jgi:DNA-binding beta-propeller fold protein YncE
LIEVVFPVESVLFDRDSDGLVDIEVRFLDSLSGVDAASVRLVSDREVKGQAGARTDLLAVWRVARSDSSGFVVEEVPDFLLPRGRVELTIEVTDRKGNLATHTVEVRLPVAARHRVIDLQADLIFSTSLLLRPDGLRLYATTEEPGRSAISIVDPWSLEWLKTVRHPQPGLSQMAYDAARGRIYAMSIDHPEVAVFDVALESFTGSIATAARGVGLALGRQRDELYAGLEIEGPNNGLVGVIDLTQGVQSRVLDLGVSSMANPGATLTMKLELDTSEERLFILTSEEGLLIADPAAGRLLDQIDLLPGDPRFLGGGKDLIRDEERLLASLNGRRIALIPIADPRAYQLIDTSQFGDPRSTAVSPDRREWVVTLGAFTQNAVTVMDATTFQFVWSEVLVRPIDSRQDVVFRSDGNVFFVVGGRGARGEPSSTPNELTVYLYR